MRSMETAGPPRTSDGDGFRFRAGRPSLDLCSTVLWRHVSPVEQLRQPHDLARWLTAAGLWPRAHPVGEAHLRAARRLREALYRSFVARIRGEELADTAVVNRCAERPDPIPRLTSAGELRWLVRDPVPTALSAVARDGIDLLA